MTALFNTVCKHAHYKTINKIIVLSRHTVECVTSPYLTLLLKPINIPRLSL